MNICVQCVCVREREGESEYMCTVCCGVRERVNICVQCVCVCVREREGKSEYMCTVCVCVCEGESEYMCTVCVCVCEGERGRE